MKYYEHKADYYAEEHGIIDYKVNGNKMTYYANYPKYLAEPRRTYKVVYDLESGVETRTLLKKYYRRGIYNMYK